MITGGTPISGNPHVNGANIYERPDAGMFTTHRNTMKYLDSASFCWKIATQLSYTPYPNPVYLGYGHRNNLHCTVFWGE